MELVRLKELALSKKNQAIYALFGFLLGVAPLTVGVLPFGCAFLCALPKKHLSGAFFGVLAACLFDECIILAVFCAVYLLLVIRAKEKNGVMPLYARLLLSLSISALRVAYIAVNGVSDIEDVFSLSLAVIAYPAFTYAFSGYFGKKKELHPKHYDVSLIAFAFAISLLLSRVKIGSVSLALLPAAAFTLCAARSRGFAFGGACGVLCGLASGGAATGALGVMGMAYGLLACEIEPLAVILSFLLAVCGYFYLSGSEGIVIAGILLCSVYAVFIPLRKKIPLVRGAAGAEKRQSDKRILKVASAFSSLSSLFYTVSESTRKETVSEVNSGIRDVVDDFCSHCNGCELEKSEISNFFTSEIRRSGVVSYASIPTHISTRCPNAFSMARGVNKLPLLRASDGEKRLKQMADEYSAFSSILIDTAKKQQDGGRSDKELAKRIKNALRELGITCDGVKAIGTRRREITVFGVNPERFSVSPNEIAKAVAAECKTEMSAPEFLLHDGYTLMKLCTVPAVRIECAKISEAKTGEAVCGDTVSSFENDDKYFYCLVSDGMGSGRDAALTSRLSAIMLEKLLSVGAEKESALTLLNKALAEKKEEVFATVDLLEIDRFLSRATLIKAGAAPTILIRNGKTAVIEARTPPAGIMRNLIAEKKSFSLQKGDMIVMLSDGILQTGSENTLLPAENIPPMPSARALALQILRTARERCEAADDMSVCVLRIY